MRGTKEKFFSKFPLRPRKHLCRAICQAGLSVRSPSELSCHPLSLFISLSLSLFPVLCSPPSFSTLLSVLGDVLFAFKWQHFNLHAKSARRPPGRHPLPLSRPDFHLNSQNGADSAGLQNFLLKDSMRITRMLGIKKTSEGREGEGERGKGRNRDRDKREGEKGWRKRVGRSELTLYEALFSEIKCPLSVLCFCVTCWPLGYNLYFALRSPFPSKARFECRYYIANRQLIPLSNSYCTKFCNRILSRACFYHFYDASFP